MTTSRGTFLTVAIALGTAGFAALSAHADLLPPPGPSSKPDITTVHAPSNTKAPAIKAPAAKAPVHLPPLLKEVEEKYGRATTLTASFTETTKSAALKTTKTSSGVLSFKRPGKVRWETLKPDRNLLVGDGTRFWYYTPPFDEGDSGQYSVRDSSQVQSKFAQLLLSASFSSNEATRSMKMKVAGSSQFMLLPRRGTAGTVKQAVLTVDPARKLITEIQLTHRDGNQTQIVLNNIELGKNLDDQLFQFTPPPNTEKLAE
jgi:outer membrane lipoprotein carrier protein